MRRRKRAPSTEPPPKPSNRNQLLVGFVVGFLSWFAAMQFLSGVIQHIGDDFTYILAGVLSAWLAVSRFRKLLWVGSGLLVLGFLVFGYTPTVAWMTRGWVRSDALQNAPAAVVLAADGSDEVEITEKGEGRLLHGYDVVRQGYAPLLVVSRGASDVSWIPAVRRQTETLALNIPIIETKRVRNTYDEAVAVAEIAKSRGWREVILITHPVHMRRAAAVFEHTGLSVIASPCKEWRYNLDALNNMPTRLTALREWLHEAIGCWVYRWRGWIK